MRFQELVSHRGSSDFLVPPPPLLQVSFWAFHYPLEEFFSCLPGDMGLPGESGKAKGLKSPQFSRHVTFAPIFCPLFCLVSQGLTHLHEVYLENKLLVSTDEGAWERQRAEEGWGTQMQWGRGRTWGSNCPVYRLPTMPKPDPCFLVFGVPGCWALQGLARWSPHYSQGNPTAYK